MNNPILNVLADLLRSQISVVRVERGPLIEGSRKYTFICKDVEPIFIDLKETDAEIVAMYKQAKAYWSTFKSITLPDDD